MSLSRSRALIRHEMKLQLSEWPNLSTMILMPLVMIAFFKPLARLALTAQHPGANGAEYSVPAMSTMFAFFLVAFIGFSFFMEHRWNTWERLRASPATNAEIMVGKVVPAVLLCLVQQGVLFGSGFLVFGLRINGSLAGLFAVIVALAFALTAIGVLLAAVVKNEQQMNVIGNIGSMVLAGVSGALVPLSVLPGWARTVAPFTPQYWALRGFRSVILDHGGISSVALPVAVLLMLAAGAAVLALMRFRFDEPKVQVV
ncbi:MAG TPA: ABC transporter permease [Acidimicrobiales bacterium]|nr:ABC transporter permease [Acidimicrobiales bacterium]